MANEPGSIEELAESVNALTRIIERVHPMLETMADQLAVSQQTISNLRTELYATRARVDELAESCLYLVEAVRYARLGESRAIAERDRLRALVDEHRILTEARDRETPPKGTRVSWNDE